MAPILRLTDLSKSFQGHRGLFSRAAAKVDILKNISLEVRPGERLGLVGESGSGKTTLARILVGLTRASGGQVELLGRDITAASPADDNFVHANVQMVFQDPLSSLNPRKTVLQSVLLPLEAQRIGSADKRNERARGLLRDVGLPDRYHSVMPAQLSGGQRQRVGIARALAVSPKLLILDEPTASLDVSVQARVLNLLAELNEKTGIAQIMISHSLGVIRNASDRVAVMYLGQIVEVGGVSDVFSDPRHPYTRVLLSAFPTILEEEQKMLPSPEPAIGEVVSPTDRPAGCAFRTRCRHAMSICSVDDPLPTVLAMDHEVRCHLITAGGPPAAAVETGATAHG
ncbi:ABC transporter ATP-binding protein [Aminobacter sp. MSH1]|uniref:oligopeptide/dipeptide ABC transporter ATP-binding protein n=1 Tax=Aminobacter sp. MSH1 TaxID=374606 RepID=UPI00131EE52C|nr:ABC transporter ATP-binding protein [Aminobacter sp. MSH1]